MSITGYFIRNIMSILLTFITIMIHTLKELSDLFILEHRDKQHLT